MTANKRIALNCQA